MSWHAQHRAEIDAALGRPERPSLTAKRAWEQWPSEQPPPPRHFHVSVYLRGCVYMFGGFRDGEWLNDLWAYSLRLKQWQQLTWEGPWPCERASCVAFTVDNSRIVLHGGYRWGVFLDDLWTLHVGEDGEGRPTFSWQQHSRPAHGTPQQAGGQMTPTWPRARSGHSGVRLGPLLVMFGGRHEGGRFDDLFVLNTFTMRWHFLESSADTPPPRKTHASARVGTTMYVFGGNGDAGWLGDMWELDLRAVLPALGHTLAVPRPPPSLASDLAGLLPRRLAKGHRAEAACSHAGSALPSTALPHTATTCPGLLLEALAGVARGSATMQACPVATAVAAHAALDQLLLQRYGLDQEVTSSTDGGTRVIDPVQGGTRTSEQEEDGAAACAAPSHSPAAGAWSGGEAVTPAQSEEGDGGQLITDFGFHTERSTDEPSAPADLEVVVGGEVFPLHGSVLAARSAYFATLMQGRWVETARGEGGEWTPHRVELGELLPRTFTAVVQWVYTDNVPGLGMDTGHLRRVLAAADRLGCAGLAQLCQRFFEVQLSVDSAVSTLLMADSLNVQPLRDVAMRFVQTHFADVTSTPGFSQLPEALLREVLVQRTHAASGTAGGGMPGGDGHQTRPRARGTKRPREAAEP